MKVNNIVQVSLWQQTKLHILCFIYGFYLILKCLVKWTWHRKNLFRLHQRDKPPPCLVNNNLGEHSYVKLKGIKLHYVETGEKFQPLLLLLHGFPDCWLSWREQLPILSEHYRVVALDLKGFGDSDKPTRRRSYRIEVLINELQPLVNQTLLIVGNSDPFFSLESIVHSSEYTSKSNIKVIKGAQHFPHQEKPDMVNQVILNFLIGPPVPSEKTNGKSIVSTWLGSLSSTVKYGNQMIDAVHKKTNDVVSHLPHKVPYLGHTTT
ncbi:Similar to Ephx4: Epoxide hydrolase 4 (Mus musculus) [Cotesia congregata]|uniref:Similar to Ephx4: Epoxide hydrolase 4 (Mus musculus) n=1 Tax=Cotesia congregata TaxID=51543 RepID=A0A8J2HP58_COTCN|nr:Similar to Ephx4: Epoxide hydrolase 4 (Mus musculus) [Cotesia congregata]